MSSKPDKVKDRQDFEDTTEDEPGQSRQPGQQKSGQPDQPQQKQKDDPYGKGNPRSGQR